MLESCSKLQIDNIILPWPKCTTLSFVETHSVLAIKRPEHDIFHHQTAGSLDF